MAATAETARPHPAASDIVTRSALDGSNLAQMFGQRTVLELPASPAASN
jgi:hypothetical protein